MKIVFCGTFSRNGLQPGAKLFDPEGNEVPPARQVLKGKKWCDRWVDEFEICPVITYLLIMLDAPISNNGSVIYATQTIEGDGKLSDRQKVIEKQFLEDPNSIFAGLGV